MPVCSTINHYGKTSMQELKNHWNRIFETTPDQNLGWHENDFSQTFKFIDQSGSLQDKIIFIPGAGTSMLADAFIGKCRKLILNDISDISLTILKNRIGNTEQQIDWLHADISKDLPLQDETVDLWIDRALLHFLLNEKQISGYFANLKRSVRNGGYALLAEFSKDGAEKCAGLDIHRYSPEELSERCGDKFSLIDSEKFNYINPAGGIRPYIYCLFKKN